MVEKLEREIKNQSVVTSVVTAKDVAKLFQVKEPWQMTRELWDDLPSYKQAEIARIANQAPKVLKDYPELGKAVVTKEPQTYTTKLPSGLEVITPKDTARQIADMKARITIENKQASLTYWRDRLEKQMATIKRWREQLLSQGKTQQQIDRIIPIGSEIPKDMPIEILPEVLKAIGII